MGVFDEGGRPPRHRGREGKRGDYWKCDGCGKVVQLKRRKRRGDWWPRGWVQCGKPRYGYFIGTFCPKCAWARRTGIEEWNC